MSDFFDYIFLGNTVLQWAIALGFIGSGIVAMLIVRFVISLFVNKYCKKTKTQIDDIIFTGLKTPLSLCLFASGLSIGLKTLALGESVEYWEDRIIYILYIIFISWGIRNSLDKITGTALHHSNGKLKPVIQKMIKAVVYIITVILIVKTLGYNISAILAGLGIGGAAIALASKDTLSNFFGSITVFVDKPFKLNDRIKFNGYDGYITETRIRTSRMRTMENHILTIPNSLFASTPIVNISDEPHTRIEQKISIHASSGYENAMRAVNILKNLSFDDGRLAIPNMATLTSIGMTVFRITFVFHIAKGYDWSDTINSVNFEVLRRFEEEGVRLYV
ncbi:MAG: mechanosensitive ion channel family protein [Termitinemataceae bacterium]|nr:MAG: mechanosensitive ion channel family protein [Termitinemataceae bacterium]